MAFLQRPLGELEHLDVQGITDDLAVHHLERMAGRKRMQEVGLVATCRKVVDVLEELAEAVSIALGCTHAKDVESIFGERAGFVEATDVDLSGDVDSTRRYAEDAEFAQTTDGEARADRQSSWQRGRDDHGDEIEGTDEDRVPFDLYNDAQ